MAHPVVHFEIGCRDSKKTSSFYQALFGWKMTDHGNAAMIDTGGAGGGGGMAGINGHINSLGHEPHKYVTFYVHTDDIPKSLEQVKNLGGKVILPATEVPGMGHFAWFSDPEGNVIGLWKPKAM